MSPSYNRLSAQCGGRGGKEGARRMSLFEKINGGGAAVHVLHGTGLQMIRFVTPTGGWVERNVIIDMNGYFAP